MKINIKDDDEALCKLDVNTIFYKVNSIKVCKLYIN